MSIRSLKEQLKRSRTSTMEEIEWAEKEKSGKEYKGDTVDTYMIPHNKGHLEVIDELKAMINSGDSLKEIKKWLRRERRKGNRYTNTIDEIFDKTNDESLFNENYFKTDGRVCEIYYVLEILKGKGYFPKLKDKNNHDNDFSEETAAK